MYTRNDPLRFVDQNGNWPTDIHNKIIDKAFPGLTREQREAIKSGSSSVDQCLKCQTSANAYQHAMHGKGEDPDKATSKTAKFISDHENGAKQDAKDAGHIDDKALSEFGVAGHAVTDATSQMHAGNQEWNPNDFKQNVEHMAGELHATDAQIDDAAQKLQQAYGDTFGQSALKTAVDANNPTAVQDRTDARNEKLELTEPK